MWGGFIVGAIRVAVAGGTGQTGKEVVRYLSSVENIQLIGVVARTLAGKSMSVVLPELRHEVRIFPDLDELCAQSRPHILVDFTPYEAARRHFYKCLALRINPVIGSTGFSDADAADFARACSEAALGGALISNFSFGSLVVKQAAKLLAAVLPDTAIVETYPPSKPRRPSGTSVQLARSLHHLLPAAQNIPIHTIRVTGAVPHQEIRFGGLGETVTIAHEVTDRICFGPGVALAVKNIARFKSLVTELENLI